MNPVRLAKRLLVVAFAAGLAVAAWLAYWAMSSLSLQQTPLEFSVKSGSSLRSAARQMTEAGVLREPFRFELLGRLLGQSANVKAGVYELDRPVTPYALLDKITSGDYMQIAVTVVEGWTFRQIRQTLDQQAALQHLTQGMSEADIMQQVGADPAVSPEGWFFPETYHINAGESDLKLLRRAYRLMNAHLAREWEQRDEGLPLTSPYEALILASIVEKETGRPEDRGMVAGVFINRLKIGMRLQTDPTVIYGLGERFDGNLRRRDLVTDHPYNTYTRTGMPPTPIAMPGLASLRAALHPARTDALYFVAKGDGSSHFSRTLEEHERAVDQWQRQVKR